MRAGENIFDACRDVPESEREYAADVAEGLRQVLTRMRQSLSCRYVCHASRARRRVHVHHCGRRQRMGR